MTQDEIYDKDDLRKLREEMSSSKPHETVHVDFCQCRRHHPR